MLLVTSGDCNQVEHIQKIQTCTHDLSITKRCAKGLGERHNNWCHRSRYWRPDPFERCCSRPVSTVLLKYIKSVPKESSIWVRRWKHQFIPIVLWCRPIILNSRLKNKAVDKIFGIKYGRIKPWQCLSIHMFFCPPIRPNFRRYESETWFIHLIGGATHPVCGSSQSGHVDLLHIRK